MVKRWKIRLSGTGGQGVIKAAVILAESALLDGHNATQSQVYGPESRGGSTRAEVNISDNPILFPKVENPNLLLCLSEQSYQKYKADLVVGGVLILDGEVGQGTEVPGAKVYRCPITVIAREQVGNELSANVVALGVINGIASMISDEAMLEAIRDNFKPKVAEINEKAYFAGFEAVKSLQPYTV